MQILRIRLIREVNNNKHFLIFYDEGEIINLSLINGPLYLTVNKIEVDSERKDMVLSIRFKENKINLNFFYILYGI